MPWSQTIAAPPQAGPRGTLVERLLVDHGVCPSGRPDADWQELYRRSPESFEALEAPYSLPTEWPVLASAFASRRGELHPIDYSARQRVRIAEAISVLRGLTRCPLPAVRILTWDEHCEALRPFSARGEGHGFSCSAEPQLRTTVLIPPATLDDDDVLAEVIAHEVLHAAHAEKARPGGGFHLSNPLAAAVEEMAVSFSSILVGSHLAHGRFLSRLEIAGYLEAGPDPLQGGWLECAMAATTGIASVADTCRALSQLGVEALGHGDGPDLLQSLDRMSGRAAGVTDWQAMLCPA